jgi:MFS family permease
MYMLSTFYTRLETSSRFAIFYFGNYIASGTSALIAAGILTMDGTKEWAGWRWLFMSKSEPPVMLKICVRC